MRQRKLSSESDDSTEDLIIKEDDLFAPNVLLSTEPSLNYVVKFPNSNGKVSKRMNKGLVLIILVLLVICVILLCLFFHQKHLNAKLNIKLQKYCTSAGCVESAAFLNAGLEENIDPCQDFYHYSCGGWLRRNPIPDGKSLWGIDSVLWNQNLQNMRVILSNETVKENSLSKAEYNSFKFYRSCKNTELLKTVGKKPLIDILSKLGGFVKKGAIPKTKLLPLLFKMYDVAWTFPFFSVSISLDDKNSSANILKFSQSGLGLKLFHYKKNDSSNVIQAYISYLTELGLKLDVGIARTDLKEMAYETFLFEKQLSEIFVPPDQRITIEQTYFRTKLKWINKMVPDINWLSYVNNLLQSSNVIVTNDEPILIDTKKYFEKLGDVLKNTSVRVIQNYIMFHTASGNAHLLTEDFIALGKDLTIAKYGAYKRQPRWKICVAGTDQAIGMASSLFFVKIAFGENSYDEANTMVENVRNAFIASFASLPWMDKKTQKAAKDKANNILQKIGYPKFILDPVKLDEYYKGLNYDEETFFQNAFNFKRYISLKMFKRLRKKVDTTRWYMTPATVNAYYSPKMNQIVFPAGILQPPYFKSNYPKSVNYGSMGAIIGHEITHGFDNDGRLYDKDGNYRGKGHSWWSQTSIDGFNDKKTCFVKEYSSFIEAGLHIKGNVTLAENIADNGGLKAAYKAYKDWIKSHDDELSLPGMSRTNDQIFFISFAQSSCTRSLREKLIGQIQTDVHSPAIHRVRGSIRNNVDFSKAFNCPVGSEMNPAKKCSVW